MTDSEVIAQQARKAVELEVAATSLRMILNQIAQIVGFEGQYSDLPNTVKDKIAGSFKDPEKSGDDG